MEKRLVITRADDNVAILADITHPIIKYFAKKWDADFKIMSHTTDFIPLKIGPLWKNDGITHYRILELKKYFNTYDRILCLDTDIVINKNCKNLFEKIPYDSIGCVLEDKGSRLINRQNLIKEVQKKFGNVGWKSGYINTGVFLTSKIHAPIFSKIKGNYWTGFGFDDIHLGYQINKYNFKIYELSYKYNHMTMFSEPWNNFANRFDSYIIHYAGKHTFDENNYLLQIKKDIKKIWGDKWNTF